MILKDGWRRRRQDIPKSTQLMVGPVAGGAGKRASIVAQATMQRKRSFQIGTCGGQWCLYSAWSSQASRSSSSSRTCKSSPRGAFTGCVTSLQYANTRSSARTMATSGSPDTDGEVCSVADSPKSRRLWDTREAWSPVREFTSSGNAEWWRLPFQGEGYPSTEVI